MAKPVQVTCRYCKRKIDRDTAYSEKERIYFCDENCYTNYYGSDSDDGQKDLFLDYVWNLYDKEYRTSEKYMLIRKQAEHYHNEYGFKYQGMLLAVKWHVETLEHPWKNQYGLGQALPDRYMQLKHHYEEQQALKKRLDGKPVEEKVAVVKGSKRNTKFKGLDLDYEG